MKFLSKWSLGFLIVFTSVVLLQRYGKGNGRMLYLKVPEENLRSEPSGPIIAKVTKHCEMEVLQETDKWVRVQITGWIWKDSVTDKKPCPPGQMRALHILVKTRAEARAVLDRLAKGEDFEKLAREKSIDPATAPRGGDLGCFAKGDLLAAIEEAIMKLKPGEVSDIVPTKYGFHLFKRIE